MASTPAARDKVRVLFVCTANRVRSPFAAAVARRRVDERRLPIHVGSAGTLGSDGAPALEQIERQARRYRTDLSAHRSSAVTAELLEVSDLVVTMTGRQVLALVDLSMAARSKTVTLREWARRSEEGERITEWTRGAVSTWLIGAIDRPVGDLMSRAHDIVDPTTRWPHRFGRTAAEIDRLVGICLDPHALDPSVDGPADGPAGRVADGAAGRVADGAAGRVADGAAERSDDPPDKRPTAQDGGDAPVWFSARERR